jgi:hypothetical protein
MLILVYQKEGERKMSTSRKVLREELKMYYLTNLITHYTEAGEEVLRIKSNEIAIPVVDREGNEDFIKIVVSIPTGANKGTEPFDAYELAEEYQMKVEEKAKKQIEAEEKKKKKIAQDEKRRSKEKEIHEKNT